MYIIPFSSGLNKERKCLSYQGAFCGGILHTGFSIEKFLCTSICSYSRMSFVSLSLVFPSTLTPIALAAIPSWWSVILPRNSPKSDGWPDPDDGSKLGMFQSLASQLSMPSPRRVRDRVPGVP